MYEFILWMCLATNPTCEMWENPTHHAVVWFTPSKDACEQAWKDSMSEPDPAGMKANHVCQALQQPI